MVILIAAEGTDLQDRLAGLEAVGEALLLDVFKGGQWFLSLTMRS